MESSLPAPAPSAAGGRVGEQPAPSWSSFTNWTVRRGSLQGAICFETSASILEEGGAGVDGDGGGDGAISRGLLLTKPDGHESSPCEITICFRERHEIHRIYVRSTARVYEIYYASEWQDRDNEYLCTVRCGAAGKEALSPGCDSADAVMNPFKDYNPSGEVPGKMTKSESNTCSEEDGWVEVKIPDSPLLGDGSKTFSKKQDGATGANSQIYYEATAEISDASPCTSLKVRLLSLQTKECVHIEEIYIYADPVESSDSSSPQSMTGNLTGNSLLAMLVPSMLQLSKAGSSKMQDKTFSSDPAVQKHAPDVSITEEMNSKIAREGVQKTCSSVVEKEQISAPTALDEIITTFESEKKLPDPHHVQESVPEQGNATHGRLAKTLDELALRVGRIETFLSRFEENMLKPLTCINTRLQRVEQQLDAFSLGSTSSKPFHCSRISAPEFQFDDCDSDGGFDTSDVGKEDATVDSPDVVKEDASINSPGMVVEDATADIQNMGGDMPVASALSAAADGASFVPVSDMCPGLFIKAPEFMNEEDEHVSSNDISESAALFYPKAKAPVSIDDALTSALRAFMLSTSTNSPKNDIASVPESQSSNVAVDNPKLDENVMTCETSEISGTIFNETNQVCIVCMEQGPDITFEEGEEQGICHQKWPQGRFEGLAIDEVSSNNNQCYGGRDDTSEVDDNKNGSRIGADDDSDIDGAPNEVPSLMRDCNIWNQESSSDSNIDEMVDESHHNMEWLDENSTDSENESYTLRNWLYERQDDHRFKVASFVGAANCNDMNTDVSVRCNQDKSKLEIQKALNSSQNNELRRDVRRVLDSPVNDESLLLDVEFVRHEKSNYAFHLDELMMGIVGSETEVSNWLNDVRTEQQYDLGSAQLGAPVAADGLLIDLEEATGKNNDLSMEGSGNPQLLSSLI